MPLLQPLGCLFLESRAAAVRPAGRTLPVTLGHAIPDERSVVEISG